MAGKLVENVVGQPIESIIPQIGSVFEAPSQKYIVKVFDRECVIEASDVKLKSGQIGMIFNIEDADAIQRMEHELRRKKTERLLILQNTDFQIFTPIRV